MRRLPLLLLCACAYEAPDDPNAVVPRNVIAGDVVATGVDDVAATFMLLFDAANPGPPEGTGRPITFSAVDPADYSGDGTGIQAAPYAITEIPDGTWLVQALMDRDGDFNPLVGALAGATCGDVAGAHVADLETFDVQPIEVAGGELVDDVTVVVGLEYTIERPAFTVASGSVSTTTAPPQVVTLQTQPVFTPLLELTGPFDGTDACDAAFWRLAYDRDGNGVPDAHPDGGGQPGLFDIWPRVYAQYLGVPAEGGGFTNDLAPGESWATQLFHDPTPFLSGEVPVNTPTPTGQLTTLWVGAARHTLASGVELVVTDPTQIPKGVWSITVISFTGQTWTVPNELAAPDGQGGYRFPTSSPALYDPASQATALVVQ